MSESNSEDEAEEAEGYQHFNSGREDVDTFEIELFGEAICIAQTPGDTSIGHGAVVWEAAVCFAKYIERGTDKNLSDTKLCGKRVLELGCGPGLGGIATMMKGSHVTFTDLEPVMRAVGEPNVMSIYSSLTTRGAGEFADLLRPEVGSLDWTEIGGLGRITEKPFDYIICCDCVFSEALIPHLIRTIQDACTPRSLVYIVHEIRDEDANNLFLARLKDNFSVKIIPSSKQHQQYVHSLVQIVFAKPLKQRK